MPPSVPDSLRGLVQKCLAKVPDDRYQRALLDFWTAKADYELAVGEVVLQ